ncbi:rve domain-containing protein/RVT_3 domain-containing protein [Gossypium australe]|uniref:Rve domain-containing protein/RVT_3 domain-containing protein n=1 Tax=Gossypium australe TaxID=47621 RepID=A0A5B6UFM6_9ROSI|nr:rve domain-containing protein/RVT_3 domain-containing protein [Gossypium australe]
MLTIWFELVSLARVQRQPAEPLKIILSFWPFLTWGIDILGPFPIAIAQKKFIVVAVDYFSKWVEAKALVTNTEKQMESFLWKSIVCKFGKPCLIITNNDTQF